MEKKKLSLLSLFLVILLDMVGIGLIAPIVAPLLLSDGFLPVGTSYETRTIVLGFLTSIYPLAMFFSAPIIGAFADKYGRKPVLIISLAGTCLGYLLFAIGVITGQLWLLFVSRLIDGITGGNAAVVHSAVADVSDPSEKAKNFGLIGMAFGIGFIIGPFLGGVLSDPTIVNWFNFATPFWFAAILSLLNLVAVSRWFKETLIERNKNIHISPFTGIKNTIRAFQMKHMRVVFIVLFLQIFGFAFFTQFFQVYLIEKFGATQRDIGFVFGYLGLWIAIVQGTLVRFVSKRKKPEAIIKVTLLAISFAIPAHLLAPSLGWIYVCMPFLAICNGLTMPNMSAVVSNSADKQSQGEIMGITASLQSLGVAIPPMIAGFIVAFHPSLPTLIAGVLAFMSWLVFVLKYKPSTEKFHEV
ncbi:MAG: MFS transporter [Candidatus Magasanikbacteria bacterium]|nr:MFS transporter [Candidatus Magasanikbacteria bacterium]